MEYDNHGYKLWIRPDVRIPASTDRHCKQAVLLNAAMAMKQNVCSFPKHSVFLTSDLISAT